jgi:superfamily I DNA/RNA helicase
MQARQYCFAVTNTLERDPLLLAPEGHAYQGKLVCPYGYGVVFSEITRKQFEETDLAEVFPSHLVLCKDEMTESADAQAFQERLWSMFNVQFPHALTLPQVDRIRWHMFPELRISQDNLFEGSLVREHGARHDSDILRVMDLQQEQLARSLGSGHRVIHGVAGSGKTLILGYRCGTLVKSTDKPILVLCFNVALAAKLEHQMHSRGLGNKVTVRNFHRWCLDQVTLYHVLAPPQGDGFYERLVCCVQDAVVRGQIPRAQYGAVLIDEGHDFEADWLTLITQMIDPASNTLLLLYDDAQSIYGKKRPSSFSFKSVGIQAVGRTTILRVNYRNTDEIQHCAYQFANEILTPTSADDDGVPLVEPEMAGRHGPAPVLVRVASLKAEAECIAQQFKHLNSQGTPWSHMAVLYVTRYMAEELTRVFIQSTVPFEWMKDRPSKRFDPSADAVKVLTLHSSKGLEFPVVAILGLGSLPHRSDTSPDDARVLYVGMTRATEQLFMTASRDSIFVNRLVAFKKSA